MKNIHRINGNIYITSDEEIKEGDWFVVKLFKITGESDGFHIEKCTKLDDVWCNNFDVISTRHKNNCKKIILTTDQDLIKDGGQAIDDEFLEWFVKNPSCEGVEVEKGYRGVNLFNYKIILPIDEPKQETLEEVAERIAYDSTEENKGFPSMKMFIEGTKWQMERSYSEEEVLTIIDKYQIECQLKYNTGTVPDGREWFEQFKKK